MMYILLRARRPRLPPLLYVSPCVRRRRRGILRAAPRREKFVLPTLFSPSFHLTTASAAAAAAAVVVVVVLDVAKVSKR